MQNLRYVGNNLFVEKLSVKNILKKNKTPFYIYSESQIAFNFLKFANTFKKTNPLICFAAKSNSNLNILRVLITTCNYEILKKITNNVMYGVETSKKRWM